MKTEILMVYPQFPATYWSLKYALPFVRKKTATIPLGLLTVAALLPDEYSVKLIDMNVSALTEDAVKNADLVFISAMIVQRPSFDKIVALCNRLEVPVVAGGPYPSSSHEKISGVDHFVLNEAELTLQPFINDYEKGKARSVYTTDEKPDITQTPPPRFDLIDFKHYNNIALQNSRGCPFNCEFCDIIELFGRVPRFKEPEQFVNEIDIVYRQGFRGSLFIVDDNFIGNKKKVKELLRAIIAWQKKHNYPISFFTEASINMADDDELLDLMVRAGFDMAFVGIETPDADSLKSCNKSQNVNVDLVKSVHKIQGVGIEVTGGFIVGFDEDTEDIFDRQIDFIQKAGVPMAMIGILGALPHTQLYKRLETEGRLKKDISYSGDNAHNLGMSFVPVMPEETIIEGYKNIISQIYSPAKYFERCFTLLNNMPRQKPSSARKVTMVGLYALLMSLIKQTFSKYSFRYLRFLTKVILRKPSYFPMAIEQAIKGYHFFMITEDLLKADELSTQLASAQRTIRDIVASYRDKENRPVYTPKRQIKYLTRYKKMLEKKYGKMNREVQEYLDKQFTEYIQIFNKYMPQLNKLYQ